MRLTPIRRSLGLALVPALLFGFTACGGDDNADDAGTSETSTEPSDDTEESSDSDDATEPAAGEEVDPADFAAMVTGAMEEVTTAHISMTTGGGSGSMEMEGDVDYSAKPPTMAMTMTNSAAAGQEMEIRMVDGQMYINMGEMSQGKFVEVPMDDPNSPMGDMTELTDQMDPSKAFDQFSDALKSVQYIGEEEVDGEDTEHYTLTIDPSKIDMGSGSAQAPKDMTYDLWLDDDDRMRQMKMDLGDQGTVDMTISEWGEPIDVEKPAANEITKMPGM